MISPEAFSELLEVLYSAPLEDEQWERFLVLLSKRTQSNLAVFLCADSRLGVSCRAQGGSRPGDRVDVLAYNQRYVGTDPFRAPCFRNPSPRIVQGDDLLPDEGLLKTDLYRDLLAPQRCRYATLILLTLTIRRIELITIWRTIDQGPMDDGCNHVLNLLLPHIQKALEIRQVLGVTQQRLAGAQAMSDASSTATFLLTRQGYVVHSNARADALVSNGSALSVLNGVLVATDRRSREALRTMLLESSSSSFKPATANLTHALSLPRDDGQKSLQLLASPVPHSHRCRSGADILLLVTDPERSSTFPDTVLHALYRLTPAETEVANGLLMGYSLGEIASLRRVKLGTLRTQMKSLLSKTGTSRQSELMRLLMTLPQPATAD
jgi:DNA-binding CsgD family transcriptional regulator